MRKPAIARLGDASPEERRAERPDDLAWEQRLSDPRPLPKLKAFLRDSAAEGNDAPLDLKRL